MLEDHNSVVNQFPLHEIHVIMILRALPFGHEPMEGDGKDEANQKRETERNPPMLAGDGRVLGHREENDCLEENIGNNENYRRCF